MSNLHQVIMGNNENLKKIKNIITNKEIVRCNPIDEEISISDNKLMITETDTLGVITYVNRKFVELSGFSKEELIGAPHSICHHPDMPIGLYSARVKIVASKQIWCGYVKNLCKDGKFYWSLMHMQAKLDENGTIVGYITTRKKACPNEVEKVEQKYREFSAEEHKEHKYFMSATLRHNEHIATRVA